MFVAFGRGVFVAFGRGVFVGRAGPAEGLACGDGEGCCCDGAAVGVRFSWPGPWNGITGCPSRALTMKLCQIGAAVYVEVPFGIGALFALPTQTPATICGV